MITNKPDNWREIRDEEFVTFTPAEKFETLISKEGYYLIIENRTDCKETIYVRVKESSKQLTRAELLRRRTHRIVIDPEDESIAYEGNDSIWHEVYGPKGSYEKLISLLNSKVQEV